MTLIKIWKHFVDKECIGETRRYKRGTGKSDIPHYKPDPDKPDEFLEGIPDEMRQRKYPLIGLNTLELDNAILIVEGHKAQSALEALGFTCVTSLFGSGSAHDSDWTPLLSAKKRIYFLPDSDSPGESYMQTINGILDKHYNPPGRAVVRLPNLPHKGDVVDYIQALPEAKDWDGYADLRTHSNRKAIADKLIEAFKQHTEAIPTEWEEADSFGGPPMVLQRQLPESAEFPIDALGPVGKAMAEKIIEVVQCPPALAGQSVLAAITVAVQALGNYKNAHRIRPISEYFVTIAESGERKTASDEIALKPHRDHFEREYRIYKAAMKEFKWQLESYNRAKDTILKKEKSTEPAVIEAALKKLGEPPEAPIHPKMLHGDFTIEGLLKRLDRGCPTAGLFNDEGGQFTGGHGMKNENVLKTIAALCKLWDGTPVDKERSGEDALLLPGRRVSLHMMLQPRLAMPFMTSPLLRDQGYLSRVLASWPQTTAGDRPYNETNIFESVEYKAYEDAITKALTKPWVVEQGTQNVLTPPDIEFDTEAREIWVKYHNLIESKLGPGKPLESIRGFASKAAEHAGRLATILALFSNPTASETGKEFAINGIKLATYYVSEALRLHNSTAEDLALTQAEQLQVWLLRRDTDVVTTQEIYQRGPEFTRSARTTRDLMKTLVDHRLAIEEEKDVWRIRRGN